MKENKDKPIKIITDKQIAKLKINCKKNEVVLPLWKEGLSLIDIKRYLDDIATLWNEGNVQYWKTGDSYVLAGFNYKYGPYRVYCISKAYFLKNVLCLINP